MLYFASFALGQSPQSDQKPQWQPGWPCTGKEPSFDPAYAKVAEASGGQLFLFDRAEAGRSMVLITATSRHPQTVTRVSGKLEEPSRDVRVPVDSSIDSLLVAVSLQCMQTIAIYDAGGAEVQPEQAGGENRWFRAGRIATLPHPQPGVWTIRLQGTGPFFLSAQAHSTLVLNKPKFESGRARYGTEDTLSVSINAPTTDIHFRLVDAAGETLQPISLQAVEGRPGVFSSNVVPAFRQFRILAEGTDEQGYAFQRMDPRLIDAAAGLP